MCICDTGWDGPDCGGVILVACTTGIASAGFIQDEFIGGDIAGWTSSVGAALATTTCGVIGEMLGGYAILGHGDWVEKAYVGLPTHRSVSVELVFVKIDSWDGESGIVMVDGTEVWTRSFTLGEGSQTCGAQYGWHEREFQVGPLAVPHTASTLTLRVTSTLNQGAADESYGISDVLIEVLCA